MTHWREEIEKWVKPGTLKVYVYHGTSRITDPEKLADFDVILTTYSVIEAEGRKRLGVSKVACEYCNKKYFPSQLEVRIHTHRGRGDKSFWCDGKAHCARQTVFSILTLHPREQS